MAKVVNLNRFRKKKTKAEKDQRAERNRRFHGRTKAERLVEALDKAKLDKRLDGAFLIPERVGTKQLQIQDPALVHAALERATFGVVSLADFSARLVAERQASEGIAGSKAEGAASGSAQAEVLGAQELEANPEGDHSETED